MRITTNLILRRNGVNYRNAQTARNVASRGHRHILEFRTMARVTVEDCIDKVENRFELVLLASHRARMVYAGAQITIDRDNDKNPVVALREIAETTISPGDLKEDLIHSLQKYVEVDEPEPETVPLIAGTGGNVE